MTDTDVLPFFVVYSFDYDVVWKLQVIDPVQFGEFNEDAWQLNYSAGTYRNANSLISLVPLESSDRPENFIELADVNLPFAEDEEIDFAKEILCCADGSNYEVELKSTNMPFKIRMNSNVFLDSMVFEISESLDLPKERFVGSLICSINKIPHAIVVRVSGTTLVAAQLDDRFGQEILFHRPSNYEPSEEIFEKLDELHQAMEFNFAKVTT